MGDGFFVHGALALIFDIVFHAIDGCTDQVFLVVVDHFLERADGVAGADGLVFLIVQIELFVDDHSVFLNVG